MKSFKIVAALLLIAVLFTLGCNKDKYTKGAADVSGTVTYKNGATGSNDAAAYADVHIYYNTLTSKATYDVTLQADANGKFTTKLPTGNYYFSADFQDLNGFKYTTVKGSAVSINNTDDKITTVAIVLQ